MKSVTKPIKPLALRVKDAKAQIFSGITNTAKLENIPYFILELILSEALAQVKDGARNEINESSQVYSQQLAEIENSEIKEETT